MIRLRPPTRVAHDILTLLLEGVINRGKIFF